MLETLVKFFNTGNSGEGFFNAGNSGEVFQYWNSGEIFQCWKLW